VTGISALSWLIINSPVVTWYKLFLYREAALQESQIQVAVVRGSLSPAPSAQRCFYFSQFAQPGGDEAVSMPPMSE
jgi:hypothetical protein